MSIIKHVTLQTIVAHDFRYDPRIKSGANLFHLLGTERRVLGYQANSGYNTPDTARQKVMLTVQMEQKYTDIYY